MPFDRFFLPTLTQLPNGDLWRGVPPESAAPRPDNIEAPAKGSLDEAMEQVVLSSKGADKLTCLWCGEQFGRHQYNECSTHIQQYHRKATTKLDGVDKLSAMLGAAEEALHAPGKAE